MMNQLKAVSVEDYQQECLFTQPLQHKQDVTQGQFLSGVP